MTEAWRGRLVVVCGMAGSGKTTLAREIEAATGGVRLSADDWIGALGVSVWDETFRARVEALQWSVAQTLLRGGVTVIVEWGSWSRAERDTLRTTARELGAAVELRFLDVGIDELWRRVEARAAETPPITRAHLEEWLTSFEPPDADELALFD